MNKHLYAFLFFCTLSFRLWSQTLPKEGSILNYRLIGFSWPGMKNAVNYGIEIAEGTFYNEDSFIKKKIISQDSRNKRMIAEVPAFGKQYTWRVVYSVGHTKTSFSKLFHFSTGIIPDADTTQTRLRVLKSADKYADAYVFLDGHRVLYNMEGTPVWFVPETPELNYGNMSPRDLEMSPFHTITFLLDEKIYEINYNGDILWKTPATKIPEHFHHEFMRLSNGHYMVMGAEIVKEYLSDSYNPKESGLLVIPDDALMQDTSEYHPGYYFYKKEQLAKVIEYDTAGNVVWEYRASTYFNKSDLYFRKNPDGTVNTTGHDNTFYFDEKSKELYIGVRDISRILKIKYPEGTTLDTYGELFTPGAIQNKGKGLFCNPHNIRISAEGYIYLFNNNACNWPSQPTVVMMQQPVSEQDSLKKIWEYPCTFDDLSQPEINKLKMFSGGSVFELPDHSLFVNMGGQYSKLFIVSMNKEILWSAMPEKWNPQTNKWMQSSQYRASIITSREELEQLIWNSEKKP